MFSHEDFDGLSKDIQKLSPEDSDFTNFNGYTLAIAELISLHDFEDDDERYRFFLTVLNQFLISAEEETSYQKTMDYVCDMILALCLHLCISVRSITDKNEYIKFLNESIIPDISDRLNDV